MLNLKDIRRDGGTQSRASLNEDTIAEYAEAMQDENTVFPPVIVYNDGKTYWLADGFHRVAAWERIGRQEVPAEVRQGDRRRAILHSVAANSAHGLRRSNEDKRRAVMTLLDDEEWSQWSDREVAKRCGVSHTFVANLRREMSGEVATVATPKDEDTPPKVATVATQGAEPPAASPPHSPAGESGGVVPDPAAPRPSPERADTSPSGAGEGSGGGEAAAVPAPSFKSRRATGDEPHDPVHAEKLDAAPEDNPKLRAEFRSMTAQGREDAFVEARVALAEETARRKKQTSQIADLKARIKDLEADDKNAVIARQAKEIEHLRSQAFRESDAARKAVAARRHMQDERDKALARVAELEGAEIPL